jgi:mitochondrial fission protein ELM1
LQLWAKSPNFVCWDRSFTLANPVPCDPRPCIFPAFGATLHVERSASEIMINVLIHHEVADYTAWKAVFDSAFDWRHKNGERNCRIFRSAGNVNDVTLFFEWESLEKARAFIASEELKTRMASAGVKGAPRVDFVTEVQSIRRSAAD